jgi:hypothetical protein
VGPTAAFFWYACSASSTPAATPRHAAHEIIICIIGKYVRSQVMRMHTMLISAADACILNQIPQLYTITTPAAVADILSALLSDSALQRTPYTVNIKQLDSCTHECTLLLWHLECVAEQGLAQVRQSTELPTKQTYNKYSQLHIPTQLL